MRNTTKNEGKSRDEPVRRERKYHVNASRDNSFIQLCPSSSSNQNKVSCKRALLSLSLSLSFSAYQSRLCSNVLPNQTIHAGPIQKLILAPVLKTLASYSNT